MSLLEVNRLGIHFGGLWALNEVSFTVDHGEILGVIGPNGAGKTTLFNMITGFYKPSGGEILLDGARISGLNSSRITQAGVNRTFQNIRLFSSMTVVENVLLGMFNRIHNPLLSAVLGLRRGKKNEAAAHEEAVDLLGFMNLADKKNETASNLSYGEQRRLELARALANRPRILLLDEPTAGMNPQEAGEMIRLVNSINEQGITILIVEHNMKVVMGLSRRILVFDAGKMIARGTPEEIQHNPDVIKAYLGSE
jgi:branched-chain amino acid transport system ATP-binding protein